MSIQYGKLTDDDATSILKKDFGQATVEAEANRIISAPDVLYYADAYGDLEMALALQGWDKSLPSEAHKAVFDSGLAADGVNVHDIPDSRCPMCDSEMWEFEVGAEEWTEREWVDEYGNITDHYEYVADPEGHYWNPNPEDDHAPLLCEACSHDVHSDFARGPDSPGAVRVHYGETGERSAFSVSNGLIRWDWEIHYWDEMTDLWDLPGGYEGLPVALADGGLSDWLDEHGWSEIAEDDVKERFNNRWVATKAGRTYRRVIGDWAGAEETHPDLAFTFAIFHRKYGTPTLFVAEENREELLAEVTDVISKKVSN